MVVGTASHVGKSWTATAICRFLRRRGVRVAPFKAQNMSLNSYPCVDGGEIGRSQAAQAEACGLEPRSDMNPVLLKPSGPDGSQVILNGKVWKQLSATAYYEHYEELLGEVRAAYQRLADEFDFLVIEGAGAAAELNLRSRDLVNLPLAADLGVPALLVADIDRGGVFASVVGTMQLLEGDEKELVRGFVINRFRGERSLFSEGRQTLERLAERPCLGVFPYAPDIHLDAEDSVSLDAPPSEPRSSSELRVAVVRLPHIANFTDFRLLPNVEYVTEAAQYDPDLIIIPGTKNTLEDLAWLQRIGLDRWILDRRKDGAAVWGVCGGYQMLGRFISDPREVESKRGRLPGLGLLPHKTTITSEKTTREVSARLAVDGRDFTAYEIHMGDTEPPAGDSPFAFIDGKAEGCLRRGILGTYLHGALEDPAVAQFLLEDVANWKNKPAPKIRGVADKQKHYDRLADWFEGHVDWPRFEELYLR